MLAVHDQRGVENGRRAEPVRTLAIEVDIHQPDQVFVKTRRPGPAHRQHRRAADRVLSELDAVVIARTVWPDQRFAVAGMVAPGQAPGDRRIVENRGDPGQRVGSIQKIILKQDLGDLASGGLQCSIGVGRSLFNK